MSTGTEGLITLELAPGEPIQGTLHDQLGADHAFRGWLELCAAIERAWQASGARHPDESGVERDERL